MSTTDRIHLNDLPVQCIIGTLPEERTAAQEVVIHIALDVDLRKAGQSDGLADTVNYLDVERRVIRAVEGSRCQLLERLAQIVADVCLEEFLVEAVTVRVEKPAAAVRSHVAVEIRRDRA